MAGLWDWFSSGQAAAHAAAPQPAPQPALSPEQADIFQRVIEGLTPRLSKVKEAAASMKGSNTPGWGDSWAADENSPGYRLGPIWSEEQADIFRPDLDKTKGWLTKAFPAIGLPLYLAAMDMQDPLFWKGSSGVKEPFVPPAQTADAGAPSAAPAGAVPVPAPVSSAPAPSVPMPRQQAAGVTPPSYMRPALVSSAAAAEPEAAPIGPPRVLSPSVPAPETPETPAAPAGYQQSPQMKELFDLLLGSVKKAQQPRSKWDDLASAGLAAGAGILANSRKSTGEAIGAGLGQGLQQYNLNERQRIADSASANETASRLMSVLTGQENAQLQREALAEYRKESLAGKSEDRAIRADANERLRRKDESDEAYKKRMADLDERRVAVEEKKARETGAGSDPANVKTVKFLMELGYPQEQAVKLQFMSNENPAKYYHEVASKLVDLGVVRTYEEGRALAKKQFAEDSALGGGAPIAAAAATKDLTPDIVKKAYPNARYQRIRKNGKEFEAWVDYSPDGKPIGLISPDEFK